MRGRLIVFGVLLVSLAQSVAARESCVPGYKLCGLGHLGPCHYISMGGVLSWQSVGFRDCCQNGAWTSEAFTCDLPWAESYIDYAYQYTQLTDFGIDWTLATNEVELGLDLKPRIVGRALVEPSVGIGVGRGNATFRLRDGNFERTLFDGDATSLSANAALAITPAPGSQWSFGGGLGYQTLTNTDDLRDFHAWNGELTAGYSVFDRRVTPRIGARVTRSSAEVANFEIDLDREEAVGQLDVRWTPRFSTRFEIASDGEDTQGGVSLRWSLARPAKPGQPLGNLRTENCGGLN